MRLYNTYSRQKEEFIPISPNEIGIYICGPTTYNLIHIGNARPYIVFDTLRRYLQYKGFNLKYVQNFTDIDNKIIQKAIDENCNFLDISNKYIEDFFADTDSLNILRATHYPRVSEEIDAIIQMIGELLERGFAYEKNGSVYFIAKMANNYGKLSRKNIEELEAGIRVQINPEKENSSDFLLWKTAKEGEPAWNSPWGSGRPGWHIECSAMARKYIGDTLDIHAGGEDLMFPHHENEIAQSEAACGCKFANYWLHNGMIFLDSQKMAKSTGNFFLVRDILEQFSPDIIRFFILSVHYRSPLNFSVELLESAKSSLERIKNCRRNLLENLKKTSYMDKTDIKLESFRKAFIDAMEDDLNTANAISTIFDLVKFANTNPAASAKALTELDFMLGLLGIKLEEADGNLTEEQILGYIDERNSAKANKDFETADQIRAKLASFGIIIKDTREGTVWHYE